MAHLWNVRTSNPRFGGHDLLAENEAGLSFYGWRVGVGESQHVGLGSDVVTVTAIEHSPNCVKWGACRPGYKAPAPRTLETELREMLHRMDGSLAPRHERLVAGALDRTERDEEIVLRGSGRRYVHSGMHEGVQVTRIRARYTDGSERNLYLLTMVDIGEDADVNYDLYESLESLQSANTWLREAF